MGVSMQFSLSLYNLRISHGLTLTDVSKSTNISVVSLSSYERGHYLPSLQNLCRLADFFHVSLDTLMGRTY